MNEPHIILDWTTAAGLRAIITQVGDGSHSWLCGYVSIPLTHPCANLLWSDLESLTPHGGVTASDSDWPIDIGTWWIGFDCAHGGDTPKNRNKAYVICECEKLAVQLKGLGTP